MRKSVHIFLRHYQYFTSISAFYALPFSLSILLSQALIPNSILLFPTINARLLSLFDVVGLTPSSDFFTLVALKMSRSISSYVIIFPFALSFLVLAKASVIRHLNYVHKKRVLGSMYKSLLVTHIWGCFLMIAANATSLAILFLGLTLLDGLNMSSPDCVNALSALWVILYSVLVTKTIVVCNLGLVITGMEEGAAGLMSIIKASILIRGRSLIALALVVPVNLGLAALETLFEYRIWRPFDQREGALSWILMEGTLIAYLYSVFVILDVIIGWVFYSSCKEAGPDIQEDHEEEEEFYVYDVEKSKALENSAL